MSIVAQQGRQFLVGSALPTSNPALDWEGRGTIEGNKGHYDWVFQNGARGRTTLTVEANGHLLGQVRGAGMDWDFIGKRLDGSVKLQVPKADEK